MEMESDHFIAVMHHLRTLVSQIKLQSDISFGELCVMSKIQNELVENGLRLTPTKLNIMLGTKKPATSRMLAMLEKKGYIDKFSDEKDHRISYLTLTCEGEKVLGREQECFHRLINRISVRLGKDEIEQMTAALEHLSGILEDEFVTNVEE